MSQPTYRVVKFALAYDLESFDCGEQTYNEASQARGHVGPGRCVRGLPTS